MKNKKDVLYIPAFLVIIYIFATIFSYNNIGKHYALEFICLFLVGFLIGLENNIKCSNRWAVKLNVERFLRTFLPLLLIMIIVFGMQIILLFKINDIKLPYFIVKLESIIMYKQVGLVLLGYFITSNISICIKTKSHNYQ